MTAEKIPSWFERLLLPTLNEMKGELKAINTRIDSLDGKIDSLRNETKSEISRFEEKIDSLRNETKTEIISVISEITSVRTEITSLKTEMTIRLDSLEKRIPVIEEITVLKLKIAEIEKRLAAA